MINNRNTGPTPLPLPVLAAMAQQPLSHRSTAFSAALTSVAGQLATLINAPAPALLLSCSGTGGLEATIASLVTPRSRVLVLSAGAYGDLLARIAAHYTTQLDVMQCSPGTVLSVQATIDRLKQARYDVVLLTHSESSTGIYHPVAEIIAAVRRYSDALVAVDIVSSIGASAIDMQRWGADALVGATQKGLMAPAGMAIICLSERAERHIERQPAASAYLHLRPWLEASRQRSVPYTPAMNVFQGVQAALAMIASEGLEARYQRHRNAAARCRAVFADGAQARCFAPPEAAGDSITALLLPERVSAAAVKARLERHYDTLVSTGLGTLSDRLIRIGHMGYYQPEEIDAALEAVAQAINEEEAAYGD